jgi:HEAT repeat protein
MIYMAAFLSFIMQTPISLKQQLTSRLYLESYEDARQAAEELASSNDPESLYLSICAFASSSDIDKAYSLVTKNKILLQKEGFYKKCLETLSIAYFKKHFSSSQEPIKLASVAAISQEPDARVLHLLLEAFDNPSVKIKMFALRGLSGFPDEKVKLRLLQEFKYNLQPTIGMFIAKVFASWQDKRILPLLEKKLFEDGLSLDEKISYIDAIKELDRSFNQDKIRSCAESSSSSMRLLASMLLADSNIPVDQKVILKLLKDGQLFVKQAAAQTIIKRKIWNKEISQVFESWKNAKSADLKKMYYYAGLVNHKKDVIEGFIQDWSHAEISWKKHLVSILYSSGDGHDSLALQLLDSNQDDLIGLQLGLYLISGTQMAHGTRFVRSALDRLESKKIYVIQDQILPFFVFDDQSNSSHTIAAGHRRIMDKHIRLKIFHLLALKKMPESKALLKSILRSDLFDISLDAMVHFWENFGYEDREYLKNILDEHDPELKLKAALVLSYLDYDKDSRKALLECYHKQSYAMQIQILFALSKYSDDDVIEFYVKNLQSKYPLVQAISAGCLFTALYK